MDAKAALDASSMLLHVDVMDNHFICRISPLVRRWLRVRAALPDVIFDCHLMIERPDELIPAFAEAGATGSRCIRRLACI